MIRSVIRQQCAEVRVNISVGILAVWVSVHMRTPASGFGILAILCLCLSLDNISLGFHIWQKI